MKFPIVYIKWMDHSSFSDQDWRPYSDLEGLKPGFEVETAGFLYDEDDQQYYVILCAQQDQFSGIIAIQKGLVKEFKQIAKR